MGRWRSLRLEVPCRGKNGGKGIEEVVGKPVDEPYSTIRKEDFLAHRTGLINFNDALDLLLHRPGCDDDRFGLSNVLKNVLKLLPINLPGWRLALNSVRRKASLGLQLSAYAFILVEKCGMWQIHSWHRRQPASAVSSPTE